MELYLLESKPPVIHFHNGDTQSGHFMWRGGEPFVSWNCTSSCNHRLRSELSSASHRYLCEKCGTMYDISASQSEVKVCQFHPKK